MFAFLYLLLHLSFLGLLFVKAEKDAANKCTLPDGFSKVPFNITDLENRCPDDPYNATCTIPEWAWREAAKVVIPERLPALIEVMEEFDPNQKDIVLVTINYGYAFLFVNWVCSVKRLGLDPKNFTLVIVAEKKSAELAKQMGFRFVSVRDWLRHKSKSISTKAMETFGLGDYKWIAGIMNLYLTDLIDLGYNVLMQDADVTWNRNPMPYLVSSDNYDILLVEDITLKHEEDERPRLLDKQRNGGFLFYQNNCRTRIYAATLRNCIVHIFWRRSDQVIMNRLLESYRFKGIQVGYLPRDLFLNGNRWKPYGLQQKEHVPWNPYIFHASWTQDMNDKILKFVSVSQWYSTCDIFDMDLVPDVNMSKKFTHYKGDFVHNADITDWHYIAEKLIGNLLKPYWKMNISQDEPKPILDKWAGTMYKERQKE